MDLDLRIKHVEFVPVVISKKEHGCK